MEIAELMDVLKDDPADAPKYLQLSDGLAAAIEQGRLGVGDRLPSEAELAAGLPVSLGTVQKALNHLAGRGMVVRRHGHGTFVGERAMPSGDLWHFRFPGADGNLSPVYTSILGVGETETRGPWSDYLDGGSFVLIERLIDVDRAVTGLARMYLDMSLFSDMLTVPPVDMEGVNIRAYLRNAFGVRTVTVREEVNCQALPHDVATALGLSHGQAGLIFHMAGAGEKARPLHYQIAYFPPSGRRLEMGEKHG